jgi:23S rRNA pseudouridine1911/1915/1917 synthase
LGDPLYGKQRAFLTTKDPNELAVREALSGFKRQALHAARLGFIHPHTKEELTFDSELPEDMLSLERTFLGLDKNIEA